MGRREADFCGKRGGNNRFTGRKNAIKKKTSKNMIHEASELR